MARELVSQREYARRRGVSNVAVHHAVAAGRVTLVDGKIDPVLADRQWVENTDTSKPRNSVTGNPRARRPAADAGGDDGSDAGLTGYSRARAAKEVYHAQMAKLKLDQLRGTLILAADVELQAMNSARRCRDKLLALPDRLSGVLAGIADAAECHRILEDEIERICMELSGQEPNDEP